MHVKFVFLLSLSILCFNSVQSQNICDFSVKVFQYLLGAGFHRNMSYVVKIENHSLHKKNPVYFYDGCIVALQQLFPQGVYVDPNELETFRKVEKISAFPHSGINIEVAAPYAHPFNAYMFGVVKFNEVETSIPVHARYHSPVKGGGMTSCEINPPSMYMRCVDNRLEDCVMPIKTKTYLCDKDPLPYEKCIWKQVALNSSKNGVTWKVAVGDLNHYYMVECVTMLAVVLGSFTIIKAIHDYTTGNPRRNI